MEIGKIIPTNPTELKTNTPGTPAWQVGDVLHAKVTARIASDVVRIQIGNNDIHARTDINLQQGQTIDLRVASTRDGVILHRLLPDIAGESVQTQALRELLPKQADLGPLLSELAKLGSDPHAGLPDNATKALATLLAQFTEATGAFSAIGLKSALSTSGLLLESQLAATAQGVSKFDESDFKAQLLRLSSVVQGEQPDVLSAQGNASLAKLAHIVDAALAKVELNQLFSTSHDVGQPLMFNFDLPLHDKGQIDTFQIHIEEEKANQRNGNARAKHWSVALSFDLAGLGPIHARLTLVGQTMSATLWAENEATYLAITEELDHLRGEFADNELDLSDLQCFCGRPHLPQHTKLARDLIDIRV